MTWDTGREETLEIDAPVATCGHCRYVNRLTGKWAVEDGRLVFRAYLNPLTNRGPGMDTCSESYDVAAFGRITVDGEPLTDEQVTTLQASARSQAALHEELSA